MTKSNLKLATPQPVEKLPYEQLDRIARGLAMDLADDDSVRLEVMLLMNEIAEHTADSYANSIAGLVCGYLFMWSPEGDRAFEQFIAGKIEELKGGTR